MRRFIEFIYRLTHPRHKIGRCGALSWDTKQGLICAECGKKLNN